MAKNIGPGDAIITTPFTYIATAEVIPLLGAEPVFVDIYPATYNINPEEIDNAVQYAKKKVSNQRRLLLLIFLVCLQDIVFLEKIARKIIFS